MPSSVRSSSSDFPQFRCCVKILVPRFFSGFLTVFDGFPERRDSKIAPEIQGLSGFRLSMHG
jgi:hypothetical protein